MSPALLPLLLAWRSSAPELPPIFETGETILFQGDSITDGNRGRSADPNHILGHGYAFEIAARYGAAYPERRLSFVNRGVSGDTIAGLGARWKSDALDLEPDVLSVLVGTNDLLAARGAKTPLDAERLFREYDGLLIRAKAERPAIKLVLGEPFVLDVGMVASDPAGWRAEMRKLQEVVARLGRKHRAPVIPFQRTFDEATRRAPAEHWIWDGIHPTVAGHGLMADVWIAAYHEWYRSPLLDPARNSAIDPQVNFERDSYDWLHRHADVLDAVKKEAMKKGPVDVVLIGDSITHFWGGEPKAAQANAPEVWNETFRGVRTLNLGFGWDRTQNVLWRLAHGELGDLKPRTIVLNVGTNNLVGDATARENTPAETAVGITRIVDDLRRRTPTSRIVVMAIFPRGFERGNPLDRRIGETNAILARSLAGRSNVAFLDIGAKLREPDGSISPATFSDGTHPTAKGYAVWGAALSDGGFLR